MKQLATPAGLRRETIAEPFMAALSYRSIPMPHIAHIALWTDDLVRLATFYATCFGAEVGAAYVNPAKGFTSRFLRFGNGVNIELMHSTTLSLTPSAPGGNAWD